MAYTRYPKYLEISTGEEILVQNENEEKAVLAKDKPKRTVKKKAVKRGPK